MNILSFEVPTVMKHGLGASRSVAYEAKDLGMRRPLLVTDPGILQIGLLDQLIAILDAANLDHVVFSEVKPNPSIALVDQVAAIFKNERCDGLIALGGGSSMDTAKAVGVVTEHGGSILDYEWAPLNPIKKRIPPTICLPTTAGTGSEVTLWAVITDPERKIKFNVGGSPLIGAWLALIDPELTMELPPAITAGTGMDALAHAVENYTMTYAQPLSDSAALLAMEYIGDYLRVAYAQGHNTEARYKMSMAAMLAGLAYGTVSAGAAHAMSQSAGGGGEAPPGPLTGRLLGAGMRYNMMGEPR
ncbi:MAG TPA: iron-containing alcohol dehydrogenase, partial [Anaerolineae bacterium]|nr:iron-containing alcohol dehydrogenase [Anaerolineae bacterium]